MIHRKSRRLFLYLAALSAIFTLGCQPQNISDRSAAPEEATLRVGISANAPPFAFKQAGSITGLEPALATMLGEYLEKKVVFVELPWDKQLEFLNSGKIDIVMSGMTITKQRTFSVDFTKPYLRSGQIMLVRTQDRQKFITGVESLLNRNYRIGTVAGTISDTFISATINGANEIPFDRSEKAVEALIKNKIDVFVYDAPIICYYAAKYQQQNLIPILNMATEEYIGWAVRKNNPEFLESINSFINSIEQRGELKREIDYWIPYLKR